MQRKTEKMQPEDELCFSLYAASKELIKRCRPELDELQLTYTQYLVMLTLWEREECNVKELGEELYLDSGTLTPVLKSLEAKGFVRRVRSSRDERVLLVDLTEAGRALRERARAVSGRVAGNTALGPKDCETLRGLLNRLLEGLEKA